MFRLSLSTHRRTIVVIAAIATVFLSSCDKKDPISPDHDHFEAVGVYLSSSGVKIFDYFGPDLTSTNDLGPVSISVGDNGHWDVQFYDDHRLRIDGPDDSDQFLVVEIEDVSKAVLIDPHGELRDAPTEVGGWMQYRFNSGVYDFHLQGVTANGQTRMRIKVFHVDHADFTTLPIILKVGNLVATSLVRFYDQAGNPVALSYLNDPVLNSYYPAATDSGTVTISTGATETLVAKFFQATITVSGSGNSIALGSQFTPAVPAHALRVTAADTSKATARTGLNAGNAWEFTVTGKTAGTTTMKAEILHDGTVGKSFFPAAITVR